MSTLWMTLSEAVTAAKQSADWRGEDQFLQFLRRGEFEVRADELTVTTVRTGGTLVNKRTGARRLGPETLGRPKTTYSAPLDPLFWRKAEVDFSANRAIVRSRTGSAVQIAQGVYVDRESVERLWSDRPQATAKNKGGAEPKYDWVGAAHELARILYVERKLLKQGLDHCPSQAAMVERLKDWFEQEKNGGVVPGDTALKQHVSRFFRTHRRTPSPDDLDPSSSAS